jgi:uncharacterized protein HemX
MSSSKCPHCGLANFSTDVECRRCGKLIYRPTDRILTDKPPRRNGLIALLLFVALAAGGYYVYQGMQDSVSKVGANDAKRVAAQPAQPPQQQGLSRTVQDRERSQRVANAVGASNTLAAHEQRVRETENLVNNLSNSSSQ